MNFADYQAAASRTLIQPATTVADGLVPILGLAGEVGELVNEYKKYLRDGKARSRIADRVAEELGDILWYTAATASSFGLELANIAEANLSKTRERWNSGSAVAGDARSAHAFDAEYPQAERFPRKLEARFMEADRDGKVSIRVIVNDRQMGQELTDNAHAPDGYRFHDVFHLACAAVLGWSPVTRRNLGLKRRSNPITDEVEDGGRAIVTEEGISALVFAYAGDHDALEDVPVVDYDLLKAIRTMVAKFEVSICTTSEWERAILMGYAVWRRIERNGGGVVRLDLDQRLIEAVVVD